MRNVPKEYREDLKNGRDVTVIDTEKKTQISYRNNSNGNVSISKSSFKNKGKER